MASWEYTLTGFGDFLEQRRLAFTQPMPASRVCSICGRVPSDTALLPCGHVLCVQCQREVFDGMECPFDGCAFTEGQLVRLRFELTDLEQLRVVCIVGGRKCAAFSGKLSELRDHMRQCRSVDVQCAKCHRSIASEAAVEHYRQCYTESAPRRLSSDLRVRRAVEEVRRIQEDLQVLRQQSLGEHVTGDDGFVNGAKGYWKNSPASTARCPGSGNGGQRGPRRLPVVLQKSSRAFPRSIKARPFYHHVQAHRHVRRA
ncbi:hypothetical protein HPB52_004596 [Rhipicephalus sanguineus]|uniref:RING-type domain-containing protein n=1 Tax=Rhipicephalus sanguineus TaxID=34632 RepID=A0A9D4QDL7_RHISA|nr:hypothetical protein HPB52_004596 [Rhipicephalus sanguineus]